MITGAFRVKHYESKLAALNAINSALQKENDKLSEELAVAQDPTTDAGEPAAKHTLRARGFIGLVALRLGGPVRLVLRLV